MTSTQDLLRMFRARSIAIVGASNSGHKPGGQPLLHLRNLGYDGAVYPVNPRYEEVMGWRCYPEVASLPEVPEVALIAVTADQVAQQLEACGQKGIERVIVITSGFAEMGGEGVAAQQALVEVATRHGIRMLGPNCQGMISVSQGFSLGFGAPYGLRYRKGPISMTSQSGAWGNTVLMLANDAGLGFAHYQSTGNEALVTSLDLIDAWIDDPETGMLVSYVEGFKDADRLVEVGRRALRAGKPWLLWKVGTSEAGARAAASHTANLGGDVALYRAAFRQAGAIEVHDVQDLADRALALLSPRQPRGPRVAVVTLSGGAGVLMADHCAPAGLVLPTLSSHTIEALRAILPPYAGLHNPIDLTGNIVSQEDNLIAALRLIVDDPAVDMMGVCLAAASGPIGIKLAQWVAEVAVATDKPVLVAWTADTATTQAGYDALQAAGVPRYDTPVRCATGMAAQWQFASDRARENRRLQEALPACTRPARRAQLASATQDLHEHAAKQLLADYGIPVTPEALVQTFEQALEQAEKIGWPVALKIVSADLPHKTEVGGVRIGLRNAQALQQAWDEILGNVRQHAPQARIDGLLVQAMAGAGVEVILGITNDPLFGLALMFGLGGIHAEVLRDVSFRLLPITRSEAEAMVREIRGFALLDGARGQPKADVPALVDTLLALSALAQDLKEHITGIDINPLFVRPAGQGVVAADALVQLRAKQR